MLVVGTFLHHAQVHFNHKVALCLGLDDFPCLVHCGTEFWGQPHHLHLVAPFCSVLSKWNMEKKKLPTSSLCSLKWKRLESPSKTELKLNFRNSAMLSLCLILIYSKGSHIITPSILLLFKPWLWSTIRGAIRGENGTKICLCSLNTGTSPWKSMTSRRRLWKIRLFAKLSRLNKTKKRFTSLITRWPVDKVRAVGVEMPLLMDTLGSTASCKWSARKTEWQT